MAIFDGCLLVSDVDGTLINSVTLPEYNVKAIKRFTENGGYFTLATGRCADACRDIIKTVSVNAPALILNGTVIYDYSKNLVQHYWQLDENIKNILNSRMPALDKSIGIEVHSLNRVIDVCVTREVELHNLYEGLSPEGVPADGITSVPWSKLLFTFDNGGRDSFRRELIDRGVPKEQILYTNAHLADGTHDYLEIVPSGTSKGSAVEYLADSLGISRDKTFGIGDYYNDIPLFQAVGCSAVVDGAPDDVTSAADFVSCRVDSGAVGRFIDFIEERMLKQ